MRAGALSRARPEWGEPAHQYRGVKLLVRLCWKDGERNSELLHLSWTKPFRAAMNNSVIPGAPRRRSLHPASPGNLTTNRADDPWALGTESA